MFTSPQQGFAGVPANFAGDRERDPARPTCYLPPGMGPGRIAFAVVLLWKTAAIALDCSAFDQEDLAKLLPK
jgi:hypothetical protein